MMNMDGIVDDILRNLLWTLCKWAFGTIDIIYGVINDIISLNLSNFDFIWDIYTGLMTLLLIFIIVRVGLLFIQSIYDEEIIERVDPMTIITRLFLIGLITVALPIFLKTLSGFSVDMTKNIGVLISGNNHVNRSSEIFVASSVSDSYEGEIIVNYKDVSINKKINREYVYFKETQDILFTLVMSLVGAVIFIFIALQISQRWYGFLMKIIISPYSISGLIIERNDEFNVWFKLVIADLLTGFFQVALVTLVFVSVANVSINALAKTIFLLGGLMAIMNAPSGIAQLLGGDIGTGVALQQLQSTAMLGSALGVAETVASTGIQTGLKYAGGKALSTGAGVAYGLGRMAGGVKLSNEFMNQGIQATPEALSTASSTNINSGSGGGINYTGKQYGSNLSDYDIPSSSSANSSINRFNDSLSNKYTKDGSIWRGVGDKLSQSGIGRLTNKGVQKVYKASANRLFKERLNKSTNTYSRPTANIVKSGLKKTGENFNKIKKVYRGEE